MSATGAESGAMASLAGHQQAAADAAAYSPTRQSMDTSLVNNGQRAPLRDSLDRSPHWCKPWIYVDLFKSNNQHVVTAEGQNQAVQVAKKVVTGSVPLDQLAGQLVTGSGQGTILGLGCSEGQVPCLSQQLASPVFPSLGSPSQVVPSECTAGHGPHSPFTQPGSPALASTPPAETSCGGSSPAGLCPIATSPGAASCCSQGSIPAPSTAHMTCSVVQLNGSFCCQEMNQCDGHCPSLSCGAPTVPSTPNAGPASTTSVLVPNYTIVNQQQPSQPNPTPQLSYSGVGSYLPSVALSQTGYAGSPACSTSSSTASRSVCGTPTPSIASTCSEPPVAVRPRTESTSATRTESNQHHHAERSNRSEEERRTVTVKNESSGETAGSAQESRKAKRRVRINNEQNPVDNERLQDKRQRQAKKARLARQRESPEQRKKRLEKLAAYAAKRRATETPEERERRLQDMRTRQKERVRRKKL
ncbi:hypothetical protein BIW11_10048, partial [Tropilaelaps mercedesae]